MIGYGWQAAGYTFSPDYPREISLWIVTDEAPPNPDNKIHKMIQDEMGVTLMMELTPPEYQQMRIGTMLVGGEYPDIIAQTDSQSDMVRYGSMIRLDDLLDSGNYPLLQEHVSPYMGELSWSGGDIPDGLYILPSKNRYYNMNYVNANSIVSQQGMGVSVECDDPAMVLAFLEIMMAEYWQKALFWGIEGEDYLIDNDGLFYRTAEMQTQQQAPSWQASNQARAFRDLLPKHQGYWLDGNPDSPFAQY
jgi:hypothetical protein